MLANICLLNIQYCATRTTEVVSLYLKYYNEPCFTDAGFSSLPWSESKKGYDYWQPDPDSFSYPLVSVCHPLISETQRKEGRISASLSGGDKKCF